MLQLRAMLLLWETFAAGAFALALQGKVACRDHAEMAGQGPEACQTGAGGHQIPFHAIQAFLVAASPAASPAAFPAASPAGRHMEAVVHRKEAVVHQMAVVHRMEVVRQTAQVAAVLHTLELLELRARARGLCRQAGAASHLFVLPSPVDRRDAVLILLPSPSLIPYPSHSLSPDLTHPSDTPSRMDSPPFARSGNCQACTCGNSRLAPQ
jgi:hypothetical protein